MDMTVTLIVLGAASIVVAWANWHSRRPRADMNPSLVPHTAIQFVGIMIIFLMAAHLITLITGQPFVGRRG